MYIPDNQKKQSEKFSEHFYNTKKYKLIKTKERKEYKFLWTLHVKRDVIEPDSIWKTHREKAEMGVQKENKS